MIVLSEGEECKIESYKLNPCNEGWTPNPLRFKALDAIILFELLYVTVRTFNVTNVLLIDIPAAIITCECYLFRLS